MSLFGRLFGKRSKPSSDPVIPFTAPVAPEERLFVIGDVHGCLTLLKTLIEKIDVMEAEAQIVCVGDYIDRGEQSAEVLHHLHKLSQERKGRLTCLKGNHEEMFLSFLEDPEKHGARWLRYGGLQTVASFQVALDQNNLGATRDNIVQAMGADILTWLQDLPTVFRSGNVAVTHAGADPTLSLDFQSSNALLWGSSKFRKINRADGIWIAYGHVVHDHPFAEKGVIATDTGAYATGKLTAADISEGSVVFHTA